MTMNPDIKDEWVKELETLPDEAQGRGVLKDCTGKMCCLGVLSEIAVRHGVIEPAEQDPNEPASDYFYAGEERHYLPEGVREWAGLDRNNPEISRNVVRTLASLNDQGASFKEIAVVIREQM